MINDCQDMSSTYMFGDPSGSHSARLLEHGIDPNSLTVGRVAIVIAIV